MVLTGFLKSKNFFFNPFPHPKGYLKNHFQIGFSSYLGPKGFFTVFAVF